ncbi:cytochrome P450 [Pontibacter harenae]|uniref:cytochrome P450 n=1 Tax=Pontibacter harenae TaxID=2894083 RepID=UPI001E5D918F|nr:cytochrome P450 [Pontibacter harenae]MCC9165615.1 cytochrome P450 [Pontibacter harenae]
MQPEEVLERARDFTAMVDAFGAVGLRHWRGRTARNRGNAWIKNIIEDVRDHKLKPQEGSPLHVVAWHRDLNGDLLDIKMATVELINLIRPTVAIAWYITYAALALHENPSYKSRILAGKEGLTEHFVQEVRRFYPFAPFTGARVRNEFEWRGHHFKEGTLVLLDIYGTLHDPVLWENPEEFLPERFRKWNGSAFDLIPQGGGDFMGGHRCAGEWITIEVIKQAVTFLANCMEYDVPAQDLSYSLVRMPTYPKSGFVMRNVSVIPQHSHKMNGLNSQAGKCPFHSV